MTGVNGCWTVGLMFLFALVRSCYFVVLVWSELRYDVLRLSCMYLIFEVFVVGSSSFSLF